MLYQAVDASRAAVPNRDRLIQYCQVTPTEPNHSEMVGLYLHALELKPWLGGSHAPALLEVIKLVVRFKLADKHPEEFKALLPQVDRTLTHVYSQLKTKGFRPSQFLDTYKAECARVMPVEAAQRLLLVTSSWVNHSEDTDSVVNSSTLGRKMFQYAALANPSNCVGAVSDAVLRQKLGGSSAISVAAVADAKSAIQKQLEAKNAWASLDKPRVVEVQYNGLGVKLEVSSVFDEVNLRVASFLKQEALRALDQQGNLRMPPLFCEEELIKPKRVPAARDIHEDVLKFFVNARRSANSQLPVARHRVGEHVKDSGCLGVRASKREVPGEVF